MAGMLMVASSVGATPPTALSAQSWQDLRQAAQQAAQACLRQMHHDTDEFSDCVDALLEKNATQPARRLGVAYLGLVGCLSAQRMGTLHSAECSRQYLQTTTLLQRELRVSDPQLCDTVPGDCASRLALIEKMKAAHQARKH